jgi:type IV pilus assembly protein PilA
MICSLCAAENPINGRYCLKCGALLQGQRAMGPQPSSMDLSGVPYSGPAETNGKAIGSLICGLIIFFFPSSIAAIVLGHQALGEIRRSGGRLTGSGMATTGLVLGYAGISVVPFMIIAAILIPNLLRSKVAANEAAAVASLRTILTAETLFNDSYANGFSPSLETLRGDGDGQDSCDHAGLIKDVLASGQQDGYTFRYVPTGQQIFWESSKLRGCSHAGRQSFEIFADPISRGKTGRRSFYADQTGVIRYNIQGPADARSTILRRLR